MQNKSDLQYRLGQTFRTLSLLLEPIKELHRGIRTNTIPWDICAAWAIGSFLILALRIDHFLFSHSRLKDLYPYYQVLYRIYAFGFSTAAFWIWAWIEIKKKREKLRLLTNAFKNAALESKIGRLPHLISDYPLDPMTRKMRLTNAGFPVSSFRTQAKFIESELGIFIDEIKESRERRAVDIVYSHFSMPSEVNYVSTENRRPYEFLIGQTRAKAITSSLLNTPHLLIAGQTGGGKSTFLRQLIVHLHEQKRNCRFLLIDLKGGLEFAMFERRNNFVVVPHVLAAVAELQKIEKLIDERMAFLKGNQCKDVDAYFKKEVKPQKAISLNRQIVVVDEAAEMFLAGEHAKAKEVQRARSILSRIARQGRALGIHLIVATQRPDSRSLDPQVKANLTGVICFQMMNDASSIAVLGNGRATDLPKIPGRGIWKNGIEMLEVQTPFLSVEDAEELLGPRDNPSEQDAVNPDVLQTPTSPGLTEQEGAETD